eukprot:750184-Hanusia_phi.AAC.2
MSQAASPSPWISSRTSSTFPAQASGHLHCPRSRRRSEFEPCKSSCRRRQRAQARWRRRGGEETLAHRLQTAFAALVRELEQQKKIQVSAEEEQHRRLVLWQDLVAEKEMLQGDISHLLAKNVRNEDGGDEGSSDVVDDGMTTSEDEQEKEAVV